MKFPFSLPDNPSLQAAYNGLRGPLIAALLAFLVALPCALLLPPTDRDESRFVQASTQMLESHDYININYQDTPRWKKPAGIYWLQALSVKLFSKVEARNILVYRLPSLFGIALAVFACAWGGARAFGTRTGTKAGLLLAVTFMASTEAFFARSDAVLCGFITLFMAAIARIYLATRNLGPDDPKPDMLKEKVVLWLAMAAAILTKGPEAPLLMAMTLVTLGLWDRKWLWMKTLDIGWGLIAVLALCGPWAVAITVATDGGFWGGAVGHDLATKFNGRSEGHSALPGYHLLLLPLTFFPAAWLLGGAVQTAIFRRHEAAIRFAIAWFVPTFLFFELLPTKLPHYTLPAFGGLAWLCAVGLDMTLKPWAKWLNIGLGVFGGVILAVITVVGAHQFGTPVSWGFVGVTAAGGLLLAGLAGWLLWQKHPRYGLGFLLAAGVICHLGFWSTAASLDSIWMSRQMERALVTAGLDPRHGLAAGPVASLGYSEPSFVFTMGTKTQLLNEDAAAAVEALRDGRPLFVESRMEAAFQAEAKSAGIAPNKITDVRGQNYSNGRKVVITLYKNAPPIEPQSP